MSAPAPAPAGYTTVAPWILTHDTGELLDFIRDVFDGQELARAPLEDGSIGHAEIRVGDTTLHRTGRIRDPFGNIWWITAVIEAGSPEEVMRRLPETPYAHAMSDAQQTLDRELSGRDRDYASRPVTK